MLSKLSCRFSGSPPTPPTAPSTTETMQLSVGATSAAWLKSLVVSGQGGWAFDLSSQFFSNVSDYGVIVPADLANATLCTQPYRGIAVFREALCICLHYIKFLQKDTSPAVALETPANMEFFGSHYMLKACIKQQRHYKKFHCLSMSVAAIVRNSSTHLLLHCRGHSGGSSRQQWGHTAAHDEPCLHQYVQPPSRVFACKLRRTTPAGRCSSCPHSWSRYTYSWPSRCSAGICVSLGKAGQRFCTVPWLFLGAGVGAGSERLSHHRHAKWTTCKLLVHL